MQALGNIRDPAELIAARTSPRSLQRAYNPAGAARQLLAVLADADRSAEVARSVAPP